MKHHVHISKVVGTLLRSGAHTATQFLSEKLTVRVTRRMFGAKGRRRFDSRSIDLVVTIGRPNYDARAFIKAAKQAGERFPVRRIQLVFPAGR